MATNEPLNTKDLLLKGSKGIKVSQLQDALLAYPKKFNIPESSAVKALRAGLTSSPKSKGSYGNLTEAAVKDFQNYIRNTLDKTVTVDGKTGPNILSFLLGQPPQPSPNQPSNTYTPITVERASGREYFRTITGVVRNKQTQEPISNVKIFFNPDPNNNTLIYQDNTVEGSITSSTVVTNNDGKFSIDVTQNLIFYAGGVLPDVNTNLQLNNTQSVTFLNVAPDLASIQTLGSFTTLPKENQDEVRNHTKITFEEIQEFIYDDSKRTRKNKDKSRYTEIIYKYVGPNGENYIIPFDAQGNWILNLGDIYLTPSTTEENQLAVVKNKQFTKEQREKILKNPKLKDFLSELIDKTAEFLKQRLISLIFDQLKRLGINNPEEIIDTLKQFDNLLAAEAEKAASPQEIQRQIKEANDRIFAYQSNLTNPFLPASILADSNQKIEEEKKKIKELEAKLSGQPTNEGYNPYTNTGTPSTLGEKTVDSLKKQSFSAQEELGVNAVKGIKQNSDQLKNKNTQKAVAEKLLILISRNLIYIKPKCPPDDVLSDIIKIRNSLTRQLNGNNKILLNVQKSISVFNKAITTFQQAKAALLAVLAAAPAPAAFLTSGIISAAQDAKQSALDKFEKQILKIKAKIEPLEKKLLNLLLVLDKILLILALLDAFIQLCAQNNNIPLEQVSQDIIKATQEAGLNGNGIVSGTGEIAPGVPNNYKGFTLEISEEQTNDKYKRRFAQARNIQGIVVLKGAPSFSSNAQILIDEIKFLIDLNNLRAD